MVGEVESQLGPVDILVNNAVIALPQKLGEITDEERDEVMTVNLKSALLPAQAVIGGMRNRRLRRAADALNSFQTSLTWSEAHSESKVC
jgi:3-oxoacyl-[acyl-carrier protein] reductase